MKIKYFLLSLLALALSLSAKAQTNLGKDYMFLNETALAKDYFMKVMRQAPADSYYYLGQIALAEGKKDEARSNFQSGLNANPESTLNPIGLLSLDYASNPKETEKELDNLKKENKKDVTVLIEILRAFDNNGNEKKAADVKKEIDKAQKNSPLLYMYEGCKLEKEKKIGEAAAMFEQARAFDKDFVIAYIKGAQVYAGINAETSKALLNEAIEKMPNNTIAYKYLADISYDHGYYEDAIKAYEKLFQDGVSSKQERTNYAAAKYFIDDYQGALDALKDALAKDPEDYVLNRLMMYTSNKLEMFDNAKVAAEKFFSIERADTAKYLVDDHMTYANILGELGEKDASIAEYKKVISLDNSQVDLFKNIAMLCAKDGMYKDAGDFYTTYTEKQEEELIEPFDYYQTGNYYYRAADAMAKDSLEADQAPVYYKKADVNFGKVTEMTPDLPLGFVMRARVNASLDPETTEGLAKPHYEALLDVIKREAETAENPEDRTSEVKESLSYLSYYYYLQFESKQDADAKAKALDCVERLLEVDPSNHIATQLYPVLK